MLKPKLSAPAWGGWTQFTYILPRDCDLIWRYCESATLAKRMMDGARIKRDVADRRWNSQSVTQVRWRRRLWRGFSSPSPCFHLFFLPVCAADVCRASLFDLYLLHRRLLCFEPRIKGRLIPTDTSCLENTPTASIIFHCFPHNTAQSFLLKAVFLKPFLNV